MSQQSFYQFTLAELEELIVGFGKEKFRAQQLFRWVYEKGVTGPQQMTNLSKSFRQEVGDILDFSPLPVLSHLRSQDGTEKFLFEVGEGLSVESVLIPSDGRLTLCVSSEVGCNMACHFCFTGKQKLKRRLTAGEIVGQFLGARSLLLPEKRISNIVFMGMGEPLDNPEAVFKSVEIFHSPWGINFSRKKITISTSGLVPLMGDITAAGVRLAVSLNGVNDEIRSEIMPINQKYPLNELLKACKDHADRSGDRVTFEYVLLKGKTDSLRDARSLYRLTKGIPCKINLIPFNEHPDSGYQRPAPQRVLRFQEELLKLGAQVYIRRTMGRDIYAACGQLRTLHQEHPERMEIDYVVNSGCGQLGL